MWSKLTSHIGLWIAQMDREERTLRPSCSLSMLNQRNLTVVSQSRSSDNLHRVVQLQQVQQQQNQRHQPNCSPAPVKKHSTGGSIFSFRKSRSRKGNASKERAKLNGSALSNGDAVTMYQSWHSNVTNSTTPKSSNNIFQNLLRPTRSRSNHLNMHNLLINNNNNNIVLSPKSGEPCCSSSSSSIVSGERHTIATQRRRRPRSAHFDPNAIMTFPDRDDMVQDINELYRRLEKLGEGSYATVYKSESRADGLIVALKEIKLQAQEGLPFTAIREASLLRALCHANIVKLHDIIHEQHSLIFVFEFMKTDLSKYLERHRYGLEPFQVKLYLYQLLRGLSFCHDKKILHRDLKPQNLLLNEMGELKLADFGLARAKSVPSRTFSHEVVTLWYRPPDVLLGSTNYSTSLDLWGVGCIFAEMCTGTALFPGTKDVMDQLDRIFSIRGVPNPSRWPAVLNLPHFIPNLFAPYQAIPWIEVHSALSRLGNGQILLTQFLQLNPADRISAAAAMVHPYFANLPPAIHNLPPTSSIFVLPELQPLIQ